MALNACCRVMRSVLRVVENRPGAVKVQASRSHCLPVVKVSCVSKALQWRFGVSGGRGGLRAELWRRCSSSADQQHAVSVTYEQVRKLLVARTGVLIDVREPWELREYGGIPGSINVPLGHVSEALQLKPEEFKEKYGGEKPLIGERLVFTCLAGVRSQKALEAARTLGYSNVQHYPGGWKDWAKHEILQTKA